MDVEFTGRKLPLTLRRIAQRESDYQRSPISVRAMRCGRGCAHGRAFPWRQHIRLYLSNSTQDKFLLIHELAHLADPSGSGHGESFYREAIRIAERERCLRAYLNYQGGRAKAANRRLRAERRAIPSDREWYDILVRGTA